MKHFDIKCSIIEWSNNFILKLSSEVWRERNKGLSSTIVHSCKLDGIVHLSIDNYNVIMSSVLTDV